MTAHEASSSSSSKSKLWNYDVFLSFSGEDTRKGFTGFLHAALEGKGYQAYMDEDDLERGEEIKKELYRGIEESKISIIVFSTKYADSSWCLDELVKIMECRSKLERHVLPIFYHVDPSHVRKQNGVLAGAFQKHEEGISAEKDDKEREAKRERVKQWRKALTDAADLAGHPITGNRREAELIREIIDKFILKWLPSTDSLHVANHQVGINSRIQDIITYLSSGGSNDVLMVGILGMGGLGKTTAAKAIYNRIHHKFEFKSFLPDIRDNTSKHRLVDLQGQLVSDILEKKQSRTRSVVEGISLIKEHLRRRRVLVIMDNIDEVEQLNAIAGNHDWFGSGSRIIITTRDEHLLKQAEVNMIYPAQKLNEGEALELFSWHAFGHSRPNEENLDLSKKFVSKCGGLPLALEVLGSFLFPRPIVEWKSQLEKMKTIPEGKIIKPLRISFEGLDYTQKAIFLDISCFFIGNDKDYVTKVLDGCGFFATIGISVLRERCLVTVVDNKLYVHDLLREMARVIISEKSLGHPGKWSRLWNLEEVTDVLTNESGTGKVEGLALDLQSSDKASFRTEAFAKMKKLRLLQLSYVELNGEYKHLPKELIQLCWRGFPLQSIPDNFLNEEKLVVLDMQSSKLVKVWEGSKSFQKLKIINLSNSKDLEKSPDISQVPNLEELILECCCKLSEIHPSIGHLKRLSLVKLEGCKLRYLPEDFYKSESIETLSLSFCDRFKRVPRSIVGLKNLTSLDLSFCGLVDDEIPKELGSLISLQDLNLAGNPLHTLPSLSGLSKLETLRLNECKKLHTIPDLPTNLKFLYAAECLELGTVPNFSEMSNMRELQVTDAPDLFEVPGLDKSLNSMTWIDMQSCTHLGGMDNILQGWTSCGFGGILLHKSYVPNWIEFVSDGNKVSFDIPQSDDRNFEGLTLFCLYRFYYNSYLQPRGITVINNTKRTEFKARTRLGHGTKEYKLDYLPLHMANEEEYMAEDYLWQGQLSNDKLKLERGDKVDIIFGDPFASANHDYSVAKMRTGVNLVWDKRLKENMHDVDRAGYVFDPYPPRFNDEAGPSHDSI